MNETIAQKDVCVLHLHQKNKAFGIQRKTYLRFQNLFVYDKLQQTEDFFCGNLVLSVPWRTVPYCTKNVVWRQECYRPQTHHMIEYPSLKGELEKFSILSQLISLCFAN